MIKQRRQVASYMNLVASGEPQWEFMGTGFKELNESPGAQANSRRYINDKSSTKSINGYEWQSAFSADLIESEKVIAEILDIAQNQKTGADAEREYVMVDLDKKGTGDSFKARKISVAIDVNQFSTDNGEMTCEGNLLGAGDIIPGEFDVKLKKFKPSVVVGP